MPNRSVFIKAATQISLQQPLSESWLSSPVYHDGESYVRSADPDFRKWLSPLEARRMGKLLKRALVTALESMRLSGIGQPDAIITGTGLGCIESTELLLNQLCSVGEEAFKPTPFMLSTHNTISSLIAIQTKCQGYNSTYSQKSVSFESALLDAFLQMQLGDISTALVTGNDELTPTYFGMLRRMGFVGQPGQAVASEASMAMMLSCEPADALCEVCSVHLPFLSPDEPPAPDEPFDAIMLGVNGIASNDLPYQRVARQHPGVPLLHYKPLFGEGYSASALGLYSAAHLLSRGVAPAFMRCDGVDADVALQRLLFVNHSDGSNQSYIVLQRVP